MDDLPSWTTNLQRSGGYWSDGRWYDLHLERRMPQVLTMLEEMLMAMPPLPPGTAVGDLACGTGNAVLTVLDAYPDIRVTLIDQDPDLLAQARAKAERVTRKVEPVQATIETDGEPLPGGPYDVVLASLALHAIVGHDTDPTEAESRYELLFHSIRSTLTSGGHVFIGDHVGTLPLYIHLKTLERAGFEDVDCAWRQGDFFVAGGVVE